MKGYNKMDKQRLARRVNPPTHPPRMEGSIKNAKRDQTRKKKKKTDK
jgi:hypothetical protein